MKRGAVRSVSSWPAGIGPAVFSRVCENRSRKQTVVMPILRCNRFNVPALTAAADIGSTFRICILPANGRYLAGLSKIGYTAGGAGAVFTMGFAEYKGNYGETVPPNPIYFGTAFSVAAAGRAFLDTLTNSVDEFEAERDMLLTVTVGGANLPVGFSFGGTIVYASAFLGIP